MCVCISMITPQTTEEKREVLAERILFLITEKEDKKWKQ